MQGNRGGNHSGRHHNSRATQTKDLMDGVIGAVRKGIDHSPMSTDQARPEGWEATREQMVATTLALRGTNIMIVGGYHRGGLQEAMLQELAQCTRQGDIPFICLCDWNSQPAGLEKSGWPGRLKASIRKASPQEGDQDHSTCNKNSGSVIDYVWFPTK